jgi:tetratricopeptide (TPR) repeat protein
MLKALADALMADYANSRKLDAIEEAISFYEQVLQFRPLGHKRRDEAVCDFGEALHAFCRFNGTDDSRAHRELVLPREAVQLRPPNHPSRDRPLHSLARALFFIDYEQRSGNLAALTECIMLSRECLQLRKVDHPGCADTLSDLAIALLRSFERRGYPTLILESIDMNQEALQLREPGHPLHVASLNNLTLRRLASLQGDLDVLAESVSLLREALELHPHGHPLRFGARLVNCSLPVIRNGGGLSPNWRSLWSLTSAIGATGARSSRQSHCFVKLCFCAQLNTIIHTFHWEI